MESLSREIGVRTAEIELLRSKKAQEMRLANTQLENARRELQLKLDELSSAQVYNKLLISISVAHGVTRVNHLCFLWFRGSWSQFVKNEIVWIRKLILPDLLFIW